MTFYCCIEMARNISQSAENASEILLSVFNEDDKINSEEVIVSGHESAAEESKECERITCASEDNQTDDNSPTAPEKGYSKLCGYMNKLNTKGIIKAFRRRWFVFSEDFCKLYYYRSPDDILPLGEIDIARATFTFDATNHEKPGLFTISTPDKEYSLEAKDRHTCLFWLQELQRWRRIFSLKQTQQIDTRNSIQKQTEATLESGLVAQSIKSNNEEDAEEFEPVLMTHIDCPEELTRDNSAHQSSNSTPLTIIAQQKFQNFRNQVKNSVSISRVGRNELTNPTLTTYIEENSWNPLAQESSDIIQEEISPFLQTDSRGNEDMAFTSRTKPKSPKMSSIRRKLQGSFRIRRSSSDNERNLRKSLEICQNCNSCQELQGTVMALRDDLCAVEDELEASREVVKVLHRQLDDTFLEKETLMRLLKSSVSEDPQGHIKILAQKDQEIAQLTHQLRSHQQECDTLRNKNEHLQNEIEELNERTALFQELLMEKDKIVVSLTNEVFDLETEKKQKTIEIASNCNSSPEDNVGRVRPKSIIETTETEDLKDAVQAFELQNKFLNKEILELNQLRKDGEEREHKLIVKCSEWEAKCCQIQSKLLYLLKELDKPHSDNQTQEVVSRLLEEATTDSSLPSALYISTWASNKDYDDLGFSWKWGGKEEDLLTKKADNLKQRSENITNKIKNQEAVSWRVKWDNFMVNIDSKEFQRSFELKALIRSGIPQEYKGRIWKRCNDMRVGQFKSQCCPDYYENLLYATANLNKLDPSAKQIELDLLRTLPNNRHYETLDSDGIPRLRRVLLAYSRHNPAIGYCQGINRLAAISLLFMEEEDAFWCLVSILEYIMPPEYYTKTLMASQVDQRVLKELVSEKLPRLHTHLEQNNVDLSLFTFNWFLTIFVDNIPVEIYLRIWDVFLYEGSKVLFRFALAFLKICESDLLQQVDYMALNKYLRTMTENKMDVKRLVQIAFNELNPFPMRQITHKRLQHTQFVKAQLEEFEAIRRSMPSQRHKDEWQSDED